MEPGPIASQNSSWTVRCTRSTLPLRWGHLGRMRVWRVPKRPSGGGGAGAAGGEGEAPQDPWKGAADGGSGASLQDSGPQVAAAVVNEGELVAFLGQVLEVHLGALPGNGLGVANPDWFRFARPQRQSPAAAQHPVDAAQAAADEAGLLQVGVQPAHSPAQLPVSAANDVQNQAGEGARATPRSPRPPVQGLLPPRLPPGPPAGEGGVGGLRSRAEVAGANPPPTATLLEGDDVPNPCRRRPWCANLVHVGPPVGCRLLLCLPY